MRKVALALCGLIAVALPPAMAQEISVPSVTTASPGGYANPLKLDTDRYNREQRAKARPRANARTPTSPHRVAEACSSDNVPASEQRRIANGYMQRAETEGKRRADIWVREEGVRYRMKLVRRGICPPPTAEEIAALEDWRAQTRRDR